MSIGYPCIHSDDSPGVPSKTTFPETLCFSIASLTAMATPTPATAIRLCPHLHESAYFNACDAKLKPECSRMTKPGKRVHLRIDTKNSPALSVLKFGSPSGFQPKIMWCHVEAVRNHERGQEIMSVSNRTLECCYCSRQVHVPFFVTQLGMTWRTKFSRDVARINNHIPCILRLKSLRTGLRVSIASSTVCLTAGLDHSSSSDEE